jgi:Tol biopolymer transport system component
LIIFNSWQTKDNAHIYYADNDGAQLHCLTSRYKLKRCQRLRLSPRHNWLLFFAESPHSEEGRFFFWRLGAEKLSVYGHTRQPYDIVWLGEGRILCFKRKERWVATLDNSEPVDFNRYDEYGIVAVSPDGSRVLLKKGRGIGGDIAIGAVDQQQIVDVFRQKSSEASQAILSPSSWSPDGKVIACIGGYEDEIWLINADGSSPRKAAHSDYFWWECQWAPDSRHIAYTRSLDGKGPDAEQAGVFVLNLESGQERQAITIRRGERWREIWRWAADGQGLVVTRHEGEDFSLRRVDIESSEEKVLVEVEAGLRNITELVVA